MILELFVCMYVPYLFLFLFDVLNLNVKLVLYIAKKIFAVLNF